MIKINPFSPGAPVNPGMFVGRLDELKQLKTCLLQTTAGQPKNFMIIGERGIGKTSLLNYTRYMANGYLEVEEQKLNFIVIDTDIEPITNQYTLIKKIQLGLNQNFAKIDSLQEWFKKAWAFLQRVEFAGTKINSEEEMRNEELLLEEFSYSLVETATKLCKKSDANAVGEKFDGILILIDEADSANSELRLGTFFKLLSERLQRRGCNNVIFGIAGLTSLRDVLFNSHPSSLRLFEELALDRLSDDEVKMVIEICLEDANEKNSKKTEINEEAKSLLAFFSEGYPHFIQQFGYSAFNEDSDNMIDKNDVLHGAIGKGRALEEIGTRYYRDKFYGKIQSENYRQVLRIMAEKLDGWISKKEMRKQFKGKESTLTNALKALKDREIILSKEGESGIYRLQHRGFAWWIKMYTTDRTKLQQITLKFDTIENKLE